MKKLFFILIAMVMAAGMMSCGKSVESKLVGTWGLERIEYYITDYYGDPIENTMQVYTFTPGDMDNGIDMVFYDNKKGEWRDRDMDTFYIKISTNPVVYDTIVNPDTTVVRTFSYSYDEDFGALYVKTSDAETFMLDIESLTDDTFIYTNEYNVHEVERAVLRRIDGKAKAKSSGKPVYVPRRKGSLLRPESFDEQH